METVTVGAMNEVIDTPVVLAAAGFRWLSEHSVG